MVRCEEFYEKWKRVGEHNFCEKNPRTVRDIDQLLNEIDKIREIECDILGESKESYDMRGKNLPSILSAEAVRPLAREKNQEVKKLAVVRITKLAEEKKKTGGNRRITAREVADVVKEIKSEMVFEPTVKTHAGRVALSIIQTPIEELDTKVDKDSVDAIITDPPYGFEYLPLYSELARVARVVLKPGGSLLVMCGQSYLPQIYSMLSDQLNYQWTLAVFNPGNSVQMHQRKVFCQWKPVLWFVKEEYTGEMQYDILESPRPEKGNHAWQQNEIPFFKMIESFTKQGDLVLDPFLGSGTTGVVSVKLGRRFIGSDIDVLALNGAKERIESATMKNDSST